MPRGAKGAKSKHDTEKAVYPKLSKKGVKITTKKPSMRAAKRPVKKGR